MPNQHTPRLKNRERQREFIKRMKEAGRKKIYAYVHEHDEERIKRYIERLNNRRENTS